MADPVLVNGPTGVSSTAIFVAGAPCNVQAFSIFNPSTGTAYVQFFDTQIGPTVGTTIPDWSIGLATATGLTLNMPHQGIFFSKGLWVAATTTAGGTGAPSATVQVNLGMS